jgi:inorganic pyrophosphatase
MRIDAIPIGDYPPHDINVVIEVPIGGEPIKYEMDKESGTLFVDRVLYTEMRYPGNYGFVPHTLSDDGDPVDVLIANQRQLIPGAVINCRPVGVLYMRDEAGADEKIVAVPSGRVSAMYNNIDSYRDLPDMLMRRIAHFFQRYKDLEDGKWVEITRWGDDAEARELITKAIEAGKAGKTG